MVWATLLGMVKQLLPVGEVFPTIALALINRMKNYFKVVFRCVRCNLALGVATVICRFKFLIELWQLYVMTRAIYSSLFYT